MIRTMKEKTFEIAIAATLSYSASRQRLAGIFAHVGTVHRWNLHVLREQKEISAFFADKDELPPLDGVIYLGLYDETTFQTLASLECPVVVMENEATEQELAKGGLVVLRNDADKIAKSALDAFAGFGRYRTYAFVGTKEPQGWSERREAAFRKAVAAAGLGGIASYAPSDADVYTDRTLLVEFLKSLDYPAAILAANDTRAMAVIEAAKFAGISVPGKVSVLGIDNDPYVCDSVSPGISSIEPDFLGEGKAAAALLDRMLRSRAPGQPRHESPDTAGLGNGHPARSERARRPFPHTVGKASTHVFSGVNRVVLRESTPHLPPAENVVSRAKEFIAKHATEGITPADVAAHLRISRTLLDLRFRETQKTTVGRLITDTKLAEVERALRLTSLSIGVLHDHCGFANANALKNLFKARYGMSMRDWRARRRSQRR